MKISDGLSSTLAAVVVAGLAVGIGYGAHALIGETETSASPSPSPVSPSPTSGIGDDGDLCVLMDDLVAFTEQWATSMEDIGFEYYVDAPPPDEAAWLVTLHDFGNAYLDGSEQMAGYLDQAAELVTDPDAKEAFETLAHATEETGRIQGEAYVDATSWVGFVIVYGRLVEDTDFNQLMSDGDEAASFVEGYVTDVCGRNILGGEVSVDTTLKAEAATLGMEIATYFVDWDGVTLPEITESDGSYLLNGDFIALQAEGVILSDQWAIDSVTWCVEVASEDNPTLVSSYSSQAGLSEDTCESIRP